AIDIINISNLNNVAWGTPTIDTSKAMVSYLTNAIDMALSSKINAIVTCPINKSAMHMAGFMYDGHTELLAERTKTKDYAMMMAGDRLKVVLVTIHTALKNVFNILTIDKIILKILLTDKSMKDRFGISNPRIAVCGLNPHAGEDGLFGNEEKEIILPAIIECKKNGTNVSGPYPPDTVFYHAANGLYDAVICMYHDQGLIPFKLLHFKDGVNTTLGLPIIRTSVDHGTAYDIAGKGLADPSSLIAAINLAVKQAGHLITN
ncbi:MAG: 4-hydroxythreonine-4-phosphate dehydrogenase PdxA, partial [Desulfobacterales bacterium]|nr:4-hydroxythreonine-4-phosphate dehydrogenase PdxA [Desulfobacterales bacterium]